MLHNVRCALSVYFCVFERLSQHDGNVSIRDLATGREIAVFTPVSDWNLFFSDARICTVACVSCEYAHVCSFRAGSKKMHTSLRSHLIQRAVGSGWGALTDVSARTITEPPYCCTRRRVTKDYIEGITLEHLQFSCIAPTILKLLTSTMQTGNSPDDWKSCHPNRNRHDALDCRYFLNKVYTRVHFTYACIWKGSRDGKIIQRRIPDETKFGPDKVALLFKLIYSTTEWEIWIVVISRYLLILANSSICYARRPQTASKRPYSDSRWPTLECLEWRNHGFLWRFV